MYNETGANSTYICIIEKRKNNITTIEKMNNPELMTIDRFNKLTGQETLHPLVSLVELSETGLPTDIYMPCDFYGLICRSALNGKTTKPTHIPAETLRLIQPGEVIEIPAATHRVATGYSGIFFHPDLLCGTPLENRIENYFRLCRNRNTLTEHEQQTVWDCLQKIGEELHRAIDRHSSAIITSHLGLLLNYCSRFCHNSKIEIYETKKHS